MHHRSRSKTDSSVPPSSQPTPATPRRAATAAPSHSTKSPYLPSKHPQRHPVQSPHPPPRNNSNSSTTATPPLSADASPVLGLDNELMQQQQQQQHIDPDDMRLLTPPPTPPLTGTTTPAGSVKRPGIAMYRSRTGDSTEFGTTSSPHMYPYKRREIEGSVEKLDLSLGPPPLGTSTFNARKASERCRMMEGYVSFASVEGLGTPPDGVDDEDKDENKDREDKHGTGISAWARRLFVGIGHGQQLTTIS